MRANFFGFRSFFSDLARSRWWLSNDRGAERGVAGRHGRRERRDRGKRRCGWCERRHHGRIGGGWLLGRHWDRIVAALEANDHHVSNTARELQLERSHLYKKMRALGIDHRSEEENA